MAGRKTKPKPIPPSKPKVMYRVSTFCAKYDKMNPMAVRILPMMVIVRQSYFCAKALTTGPVHSDGQIRETSMCYLVKRTPIPTIR